jgi:ketosteroid isomerase-like protein
MDALQLIEQTTTTWNNRDRDGYFACYAEDCEITAPGFVGKGHQGVAEFWTAYMDAFPDNRIVLTTTVGGQSDTAVEEGHLEGTHTGPLTGADGTTIGPTGNHVSSPFVGLHTERDGKISSTRFYFDQLDFLGQLGMAAGDAR